MSAARAALGATTLVGGLLAAWLVASACSGASSHIYSGRTYDPSRDCIGATTSIDVVTGGDTTYTCDAACLTTSAEGGTTYYVSQECPPYPVFYKVNPADPACGKALASAARGDVCEDDGGSANPAQPDAGSDAGDASAD